jgi:hypothetical protein
MPIEYRIDHGRRMVLATGRGVVTPHDVLAYQREVWVRPDLAGYDELVDLGGIEGISAPSKGNIQDLASLSASMDSPVSTSKLAIVAPEDLAFGIGRMYATYRGLEEHSTKKVAVFRSREAAEKWLGKGAVEDAP